MCTCMILTLAEVAPKKLMSLLQCFSFKNNRFNCFTKKNKKNISMNFSDLRPVIAIHHAAFKTLTDIPAKYLNCVC